MRFRELEQYLKLLGFILVRCNAHAVFSNGVKSVTVPMHKVIATGTLRDIFKMLYGTPGIANKKMRDALGKVA